MNLGITPERRRDVLGIVNSPSKSAGGWKIALEALRQRSLRKIGLLVAVGITGLDTAMAEFFPVPRCNGVTYIKRGVLRRVRNSDKTELAENTAPGFPK